MSGSLPGPGGMSKAGSVPGPGSPPKPESAPRPGSPEIVFRQAVKADLSEIMALIRAAVDVMDTQGIFQWDSIYPSEEVFLDDVEKGQLFAAVDTSEKAAEEKTAGVIAAVCVVNCECDEQYLNADWKAPDSSFRVIHRLCVHPKYQNKGLGKAILVHVETELRSRGIQSIRLDVFSRNPYALALYRNQGYTMTGTANWRKGRFYLMEKLL